MADTAPDSTRERAGVDMDALDAAIREYLRRSGLSESTLKSYNRSWRRWVDYCEEHGLDPEGASAADLSLFVARVAAGLVRRPRKGRGIERGPWAEATLDVLLAAVRFRYEGLGLVAPQDQVGPEAGVFQQVRAGYRRWVVDEGAEAQQAAPLTWVDLERLTRPQRASAQVLIDRVGLLLAVERGLSSTALSELTWGEVQGLVGERCSHERPWLTCLACGVTVADGAAAGLEDGCRPWGTKPEVLFQRVGARWRGLAAVEGPTGVFRLVTDEAAFGCREGSLHGALLGLDKSGLRDLRSRAWLLLGMSLGLRGDDLVRLRRRGVTPNARGFEVDVAESKTDPERVGVTLPVRSWDDPDFCPVSALADWLLVRDAAVGAGTDDPLFCRVRRGTVGGLHPGLGLEQQSLQRDLADLKDARGVDRYTVGSLRTGFAAVAADRGASLEELMAALRHRKPETTVRYTSARGALAAAAVLKVVQGGER